MEQPDCTRCNATMSWEGDIPDDPERLVCDTCLREVVNELRDENADLRKVLAENAVTLEKGAAELAKAYAEAARLRARVDILEKTLGRAPCDGDDLTECTEGDPCTVHAPLAGGPTLAQSEEKGTKG